MPAREKNRTASEAAAVLAPADGKKKSVPIWLARDPRWVEEAQLTAMQKAWVQGQGFKGTGKKHLLLPGADGTLAGVVLGLGVARAGDPMDRAEIAVGLLPSLAPAGLYHLASGVEDPGLAAVAWGLGAYRFRRYKSGNGEEPAQLRLPRGADLELALATVEAVWLGRDLINTPASDMGPEELESAARQLAKRHGASVTRIVGDDLEAKNFPMIHAVGRASDRPPRLIELTWGKASAPRVTLVGKGVCFDTGGLDLKPASAMLIMKKDMGGAAAALALAHMVMAGKLDLRLRVLIPAVENSVAGNAFRPGDILTSRAGSTVEIGNTAAAARRSQSPSTSPNPTRSWRCSRQRWRPSAAWTAPSTMPASPPTRSVPRGRRPPTGRRNPSTA